ncbi:MAG: hypothetical protein QOH22_918 [Gemmatimonadaceae bacterium]|jgi:hypothetical protein|nr:hypothetical protein [Gemmatimonadaceae bacterium]
MREGTQLPGELLELILQPWPLIVRHYTAEHKQSGNEIFVEASR